MTYRGVSRACMRQFVHDATVSDSGCETGCPVAQA